MASGNRGNEDYARRQTRHGGTEKDMLTTTGAKTRARTRTRAGTTSS